LKQQDDVVWNHEVFRFVKRSVIDLENVEGIRVGLRELVEKKLVAVAIDMRKLQKELLFRSRFYRTIDPKGNEAAIASCATV